MRKITKRRYGHRYNVWFFLLFLSCASAKTSLPETPLRGENFPGLRVSFSSIGAWDINNVNFELRVEVKNTRSQEAQAEVVDWRLMLNGREVTEGADFFAEGWRKIQPNKTATFPAQIELDVENLVPQDLSRKGKGIFSEYQAQFSLEVILRYNSGGSVTLRAQTETVFPRMREPELSIASIAISRAELINTHVKVKVRLVNPNPFPIELTSLRYELYGGGLFWADGIENLTLFAPAQKAGEAEIALVTNFINMPRSFLDDIIAMKQVRYRFNGEASMSTKLAFLPSLKMRFNQSGNSRVIE
ncbi:MAG: LEA type 2 family protein [Treponema sp.]|jgi:LEA14-like dessication related protein|nr:LEA type 2 family protein [Treponema sp.]